MTSTDPSTADPIAPPEADLDDDSILAHPAAAEPLTRADIELARSRYNTPPEPIEFADEDPYSQRYARTDIDETAGTILHFWFGYVADRPALLPERNHFWFTADFDNDRIIAHRFSEIVARLASGEARRWARKSPRDRLAAIVALDQFTRNIFRDQAAAFENDALALHLASEGVANGDDLHLAPAERAFLYMPFMHSESSTSQRRSVALFTALASEAAPDYRTHFAHTLDFAKKHANIVRRFGRFPHRNEMLGRKSTSQEKTFLTKPGSRF